MHMVTARRSRGPLKNGSLRLLFPVKLDPAGLFLSFRFRPSLKAGSRGNTETRDTHLQRTSKSDEPERVRSESPCKTAITDRPSNEDDFFGDH